MAFWTSPDTGADAVVQAGNNYNLWTTPTNARFGERRLDEVTYPAHKALYYDRHQRHYGPPQDYFMHEEARVPVTAVDGATVVRRGADGNAGWDPHNPSGSGPMYIYYAPATGGSPFAWDPPALDADGTDLVVGRYRWTRKALFGRDVGGPEVP